MPVAFDNTLGQMTVLGLIIREPSNANRITRVLDEECPWGQWSRAHPYKATEGLIKRGYISVSKMGRRRSETVYEHTQDGLEVFLNWIAKEATVPEPIRDVLLLWLIVARESELPQILDAIRRREQVAYNEFEKALTLLNCQRRTKAFGPRDGSDFKGRMLYLVWNFQVNSFHDAATRLKNMRLLAENLGEGMQLVDSDVDPA